MANYPYYMTPYYQGVQQTSPQLGLKGRPVSSIEEVRATSIDFDGSVFFFPDLANKRIYTKQINVDGTSMINLYELKPIPVEAPGTRYVTHEEFETAISQLQAKAAGTQVQSAPQVENTQPQTQVPANFNF